MLSVILPTYNESANLPELLERIAAVLKGRKFEVIIVDDDSPDQTWQTAAQLQRTYPMIKVLRRVGRRGLSSAVVEGFNIASGDILMVMDADLQHDPSLIVQLTTQIEQGADIAVASRYAEGGSIGEWVTGRRLLSKAATYIARKLPNTETSDPMSGFFAVKAEVYRPIVRHMRPTGFKILLEVLTFLPRSSVIAEVPLQFQMRKHGESKLSLKVELQFLWQLLRIIAHRLQQWSLWIFVLTCIVAAAMLLPRAWALRLLYADPVVRQQVQEEMEFAASQNGWLLSDLSVRRIEPDRMQLVHRHHHRGPDTETCIWVSFATSLTEPCFDF